MGTDFNVNISILQVFHALGIVGDKISGPIWDNCTQQSIALVVIGEMGSSRIEGPAIWLTNSVQSHSV